MIFNCKGSSNPPLEDDEEEELEEELENLEDNEI